VSTITATTVGLTVGIANVQTISGTAEKMVAYITPSSIIADLKSTSTVVVVAKDKYGNIATGFSGFVVMTTSGPVQQVYIQRQFINGTTDFTVTSTARSGIVNISLSCLGLNTTDVCLTVMPQQPVATHVVAYRLQLVCGGDFTTIEARLYDANNNFVNTVNSTVTFSVSGQGGTWSTHPSSITSVKVPTVNGIATLTLKSKNQTGLVMLDVTGPGLTTSYVQLTVIPDVPYKLLMNTVGSDIIPADGMSEIVVNAKVCDQYGNVTTGANNIVSFSLTGEGDIISGTATVKNLSVQATNSESSIYVRSTTKAGRIVVRCDSAGLVSSSMTITTIAGFAAKIAGSFDTNYLLVDGTSTTKLTVRVLDNNDNIVEQHSTPISFTITGPGSIVGSTTAVPVNGVADVSVQSGVSVGTITVTCKTGNITANFKVFVTKNVIPLKEVVALSATAHPAGKRIDLAWNNPDSTDFAGVIIRYSKMRYPETVADGMSVADLIKPATTYAHKDLTDNATYYYTVFSYDVSLNYSTGTHVSCYPHTIAGAVQDKISVSVTDISSIPVSGVAVDIMQNNTIITSSTTNTAGNYERVCNEGYYDVRATKPGYLTQTVRNVHVTRGETAFVIIKLNTINQEPELVVWISSYVQSPIPGSETTVKLCVSNIGSGDVTQPFVIDFYKNLTRSTTTNMPGDLCWTLTGLAAGTSQYLTGSFLYTGGTWYMYSQVDTQNNIIETVETNNFSGPVILVGSELKSKISGIIFSQTDGKILPGTVIMVGNNQLCADINGRFEIIINTGSYVINVSSSGYESVSTTTVLKPGETKFIPVALKPKIGQVLAGSVIGKITLQDNITPVPDTQVVVLKNGTTIQLFNIGFDGTYSAILSTGIYNIRISTFNISISSMVTITAGLTVRLDFVINRTFTQVGEQYPSPIGTLFAAMLNNGCVRLDWDPSPSASDVSVYRVYMSTSINQLFDNLIAEVPVNTNMHETTVLVRGYTYYFSVRPVNKSYRENLDTAKIIQIQAVDAVMSAGLRALIKEPNTGKKIDGNQITVIADVYQFNNITAQWVKLTNKNRVESLVSQVKFEYMGEITNNQWLPIPASVNMHPNPATEHPYLVQWDISDKTVYPAGELLIRAVVTSKLGDTDTAPIANSVVIDRTDPDRRETVNGNTGEKKVEEKIDNRVTNTIVAGGNESGSEGFNISGSVSKQGLVSGSLSTLTQVVISSGTLTQVKDKISINVSPAFKYNAVSGHAAIQNSYRDVSLLSNQQLQKEIRISIPYTDESSIDAEDLQMFVYNSGNWIECNSVVVDTVTKTVSGNINKTGQFALMTLLPVQTGTYTGDDVKTYAYPNPVNSGLSIEIVCLIPTAKLNSDVSIKIYTVTGELVRDLRLVDDDGSQSMTNVTGNTQQYTWNLKNNNSEPVASGVYTYAIYLNNQLQKSAVKKIAIVR
jgi:hypothetical protein